jgi:DNA-binding PadR family transcriptional regulator
MPEDLPHVAPPTRAVLQALLNNRARGATGLTLSLETRLAPGALHPALAYLENLGWVESCWQETSPAQPRRARCRCYRLTHGGTEGAQQALRAAEESRTQWVAHLRPVVGTA